ncbi:hypothetical protein J3P71_06625 [Rhizobium leguminosarum]|uniref:hypothetical protein n=1 Tax=Rhizobium leguminosarum TaxID=384 RepID=UPI00144162DD|nr:hypothetical protein [Rhizobium leguminosarum]MBY5839791.1 hypothetical protein [Rhizobium leguminosarum]NKM79400.1 hypothetical protein [Rhizobium leguminosarum bv. viciae]QSZ09437.1 hypothetical protein J3P71_06625 [Rhizobium leguminosarum]
MPCSAIIRLQALQVAGLARRSGLGWKKGNTALLLDDAGGNSWIMEGFQLKPRHTLEEFTAAAASTMMSDEFFNVHDKTGPGMSE